MLRIYIPDDYAERVIRRDPVRKFKVFPEPFFLFSSKCFDLFPFIGIAEYGKESDHDDITEQVPCIRRMAVIGHCIRIFFNLFDQRVITLDRFRRNTVFFKNIL